MSVFPRCVAPDACVTHVYTPRSGFACELGEHGNLQVGRTLQCLMARVLVKATAAVPVPSANPVTADC